jgi:hypothetical protein
VAGSARAVSASRFVVAGSPVLAPGAGAGGRFDGCGNGDARRHGLAGDTGGS